MGRDSEQSRRTPDPLATRDPGDPTPRTAATECLIPLGEAIPASPPGDRVTVVFAMDRRLYDVLVTVGEEKSKAAEEIIEGVVTALGIALQRSHQ